MIGSLEVPLTLSLLKTVNHIYSMEKTLKLQFHIFYQTQHGFVKTNPSKIRIFVENGHPYIARHGALLEELSNCL